MVSSSLSHIQLHQTPVARYKLSQSHCLIRVHRLWLVSASHEQTVSHDEGKVDFFFSDGTAAPLEEKECKQHCGPLET